MQDVNDMEYQVNQDIVGPGSLVESRRVMHAGDLEDRPRVSKSACCGALGMSGLHQLALRMEH